MGPETETGVVDYLGVAEGRTVADYSWTGTTTGDQLRVASGGLRIVAD